MMLSPEEIAQQHQLLATYRRTLAVYLRQYAEIGHAYCPPALINGIADTRSSISAIKTTLRDAGVTVIEDPDDEERVLRLPSSTAPIQPGTTPPNFLPMIVGTLVVVMVVSIGWWFYSRQLGNVSPSEVEVAAPTATDIDMEALESQLAEANIELSAVRAEQVREYIRNSELGYQLLAEQALAVIGDQRFIDTIFLDELHIQYGELVVIEHFADFNIDQLKEGMVLTRNAHHTQDQVNSFDDIVEPRS